MLILPFAGLWTLGNSCLNAKRKNGKLRKSQTKIEIKEIRLRPKTNVHHRGFKTQDARKWLLDGMKVRVSIKFRGREITYPELALEDLKEIAEELADVAIIEQSPILEGKMMGMTLSPAKFAKKKAETRLQRQKRNKHSRLRVIFTMKSGIILTPFAKNSRLIFERSIAVPRKVKTT